MYFEDLNTLITMGGHGLYVWTAYGLGLLVMVWNVLVPLRHRRRVAADVGRRMRRERAQQEAAE